MCQWLCIQRAQGARYRRRHGGCLRELTRYPEIEHIDVVEIDERVIAVCREWLPQTACGFDDPRVHIHIADGSSMCANVSMSTI